MQGILAMLVIRPIVVSPLLLRADVFSVCKKRFAMMLHGYISIRYDGMLGHCFFEAVMATAAAAWDGSGAA
jgi:hypothetical protein